MKMLAPVVCRAVSKFVPAALALASIAGATLAGSALALTLTPAASAQAARTGGASAFGVNAANDAALVPIEILSIVPKPVRLPGSASIAQRFEVKFRVRPATRGEPTYSINPDWVDRVRFTLTLGYEVPSYALTTGRPPASSAARATGAQTLGSGAQPARTTAGAAAGINSETATQAGVIENQGRYYRFYRATATALTVRRAKTYSVFFYIPGDAVERDRLPGGGNRPTGAIAEVEVGGKQGLPYYSQGILGGNTPDAKAPATIKAQREGFIDMAGRGVLDTAGILRNQNSVYDAGAVSPTLLQEGER